MPTDVTLQDWNFREKRLSHDIGTTGGEFITSESVLILTTPIAQYSPEAIDQAKAVSLTQDIGISQQPQAVQIHEIGSNRKYTLRSGRTNSGINLSRALFDGGNLLKAFAPEIDGTFVDRDHPGYGNWLVNMTSSIFSRPVGLAMIFRDLQNNNIGGFFLEETFVQSHSMQASANSPLMMENVQIIYNSLLPLQMSVSGQGSS